MIKTDVRKIIMKNKVLYFLLATLLTTFLLIGCGAENTSTPPTESNDTSIVEDVEPTEEPSTEEQTEPEETEQPTEIVESTEEPTPEQTEEAETAEPIEEPEATYTYTDMTATKYASQSVNVRDLPDTSGNKLGGLSASQEVTITGQCNETSWYRIEYKGDVAYVSNKYLVDEKPVVEEKPVEQPAQTTDSNGLSYTVNKWGAKVYDVEPSSVDEVLALTSLTMGVAFYNHDNVFSYYYIITNTPGEPGVGWLEGMNSAQELAKAAGYDHAYSTGTTSGTVERYGHYDVIREDCYAE